MVVDRNGPLHNRSAIVTGATSGVGAATALAFARAGARVVITGRSPQGAQHTLAEIEAEGGEAVVVLGDVTNPSFCQDLVTRATSAFGSVDVLANVAGVITRGDASQTTDDEWRLNMSVNVDAAFFLSRAAVEQMRAQGTGGVIVNLASTVGIVGSAGLAAYCASKGALVLLTKAMALDHAAEGIRVNALCPGAIDTPMLVSGHEKSGRSTDEIFAANLASIPEGRIPRPGEIAKSMVFLASDQSSHITGVALPVDGGYLAQ